MRRIIVICMIVLAVLCVIVVTIFVVAPQFSSNKSPELSANQYVAIYEECYNEGVIINDMGNASNVTMLPDTAPREPFNYNSSWGFQNLTINDSFKIVYGSVTYYDNPGTIRAERQIVNSVYGYPYTLRSGLTILNVYGNGSVQAVYNNESVLIGVGRNWTVKNVSQQVSNESLPLKTEINYGGYSTPAFQKFTIRYNTSWMVENLGIYTKNNTKNKGARG